MRQSNLSMIGVGIGLGIFAAIAGCAPVPVADDNGDQSFVRQAVPKLLGRKAKGADEVELLADISVLLGREAVVRLLMEQPEFVNHWTDVLVDNLRMQREGNRAQPEACFGNPMRANVTTSLASFVRANAPDTVAPGGAFNFVDLIASSLKLNDLSPIYRAYPIPLTQQPGFGTPEEQRSAVGDAFNHAMLNHQLDCFACHNSVFSTTNGVGWDRTYALPLQLEAAIYGDNFFDPNETKAKTYGVFRSDQLVGATAVAPWGMTDACGMMRTSLAGLPDIDSFFAGASGNQLGLIDVVTKFKTGSDALKTSGLSRTSVPMQNPTVPGDQGYAYQVAVTNAENAWEQLVGEKLTIANYYPRNPEQRNMLWNLSEFVFIANDYSLKDLIARIMTSRFFNRSAPDVGGGTTAYRLPMIIDPWVQKDPRLPDPTPDPKDHNNGQGELVHRYSPRSLFNSVAAALDWPGPKRFPDSSYPSVTLVKAMGQYSSDAEQGSRGVDFQGLLTWEAQHGVCQKPAGVTMDWVDRLTASIPAFDAANPAFPLTVADLVATMKDWFIGEQSISAVAPTSDPAAPVLSEQAALFGLFGVPLNSPAASVPNLQTKVRQLCGVLLQSPRFMLAGLEPTTGLTAPRHRVCNGPPCTYSEMCSAYRATLATMGHYIDCGNHVVWQGQPPRWVTDLDALCPRGICRIMSGKAALFCERNPAACVISLPLEWPDSPTCGPRGCPPPWFDVREPTGFVMQADRAVVTAARRAGIRSLSEKTYREVKEGETLRAGDVLRLERGAIFEVKADGRTFTTPKGGMPSKVAGTQRPIDSELIDAAERGRLVSVEALLDKGANNDARDQFGETPLMKAAAAGHVAMVELLLKRGADLEAQDGRGFTAADIAAVGKQAVMVNLLARKGLAAKDERALAMSPTATEEPWFVLIGGDLPTPADQTRISPRTAWELTEKGILGTRGRGIDDIQKERERTNFIYRGEGGRLPRNAAEANQAVKSYMERDFAKEHPAMKSK